MQKRKNLKISSLSFIWLFVMLFSIQFASAQARQAKITGTVYDETGETIVGASVSVVGTSQGTVTDLDGRFSVSAAPNSILKVSYMGFITQNVNIKSKTDLTITLKEDAKILQEVVVTAMGITREAKSLSTAQQSIDTESMTESRGSNMLDMLTGKSAGMQIISGGGPLASTSVVMRGYGSLTGNNQPLFVVDGVPILNNSGEDGDLDFGNAANNINPDEIESIDVLKGANASALYGSDAANGVVIITTKKASRKKGIGVSYAYNMMFGTLYNYPTYQNIYGAGQNGRFQRREGYNYFGNSNNGVTFDPNLPYGIWNPNQGNQDNRSWGMPMLGFEVVGRNGEVKSYVPQKSTIEDMYKTSNARTHSVSLDKLTDEMSLRMSYTNIHADDILDNFNILDRHTFNVRSTAKVTKFLDAEASVRYVYEEVENRGFRNNSNRNPLYVIANLPRDASYAELNPWKKPDGTPFNFRGFMNPFWLLNEMSNADDKHWFMGNITFNIKLNSMFRVRLRAATDVQKSSGWSFTNLYTPNDDDGDYSRWERSWKNNNFEGLLSFKKQINQFNINADIGASSQQIRGTRMSSRAFMLIFPDKPTLSNAKGTVAALENSEGKDKQAIYGTSSFGYNNWAYIDFTARNEWSSSLPKHNNSYFYYSLGSSVVLSDLLKVDKKVFSFMKVRGSYAQVGNDTGFDRLRTGYYKTEDGTFLGLPFFVGDEVLKNPNLKPEKTESWELGADLRLWDGRLTADFTYYDKSTRNQIVEADAPLASGYRREVINAGEIRNWGTELSVSIMPIKTKNISWTTTFNWAKNNSEVKSLTDGVDRYEMASGDNIKLYAEVGKPYGVFYGNDYKRDENGNIYVGMDGKAKYDADQYLGTVQADWFGGWKNTVRIGDFDFGAMIDFQKGGNVWSYTAFRGGIDGNTVQTLDGRWEYTMSELVLGENQQERWGMLQPGHTVRPNADSDANFVEYPDANRPKGVKFGNTVYDESVGEFWYGKAAMGWVNPMDHWTHNSASSARRYIYDASYIKLREVSAGYNVPTKFLKKSPIKTARVSLVGRNVAIIHQNTPKGLDPQATSTTGNAQGFERGFNLPMATWGFDVKVSF